MPLNLWWLSIKSLFLETIVDLVYFPLWWYGPGAVKAGQFFWQAFLGWDNYLALRIWVVNLFNPMYGQNDWQGMAISFVMRLFQIVCRLLAEICGAVFWLAIFIGWLVLPAVIVYYLLILFNVR